MSPSGKTEMSVSPLVNTGFVGISASDGLIAAAVVGPAALQPSEAPADLWWAVPSLGF